MRNYQRSVRQKTRRHNSWRVAGTIGITLLAVGILSTQTAQAKRLPPGAYRAMKRPRYQAGTAARELNLLQKRTSRTATARQRYWLQISRQLVHMEIKMLDNFRSVSEGKESTELLRRLSAADGVMAGIIRFGPLDDRNRNGGTQTNNDHPAPPGVGHSIAEIFNPLHTAMDYALSWESNQLNPANFDNGKPSSNHDGNPYAFHYTPIDLNKINPDIFKGGADELIMRAIEQSWEAGNENPNGESNPCESNPNAPGCKSSDKTTNGLPASNGVSPWGQTQPPIVRGNTPSKPLAGRGPGGRPANGDALLSAPPQAKQHWVGSIGPSDQPLRRKPQPEQMSSARAAQIREAVRQKSCSDCGWSEANPNTQIGQKPTTYQNPVSPGKGDGP